MGIDKILIADDDFTFVNSLKKGLQQFSQFSILNAPDGKHALRLLSTQKISLVVTDLEMPKMDGLELLAAMTRQFPNVLSIVSTDLPNGALKKTTQGDSLFSFLNKPYDHVALHSQIIKVLDCLDEIHFKPGIFAASFLPLVHICEKTCLLKMQCGGRETGSFYFKKGMLCDARQDDLTGKKAVERMLDWPPGKYWFKDLHAPQEDFQADTDLTGLILHGTGLARSTIAQKKTQKISTPMPAQRQPETSGQTSPVSEMLRRETGMETEQTAAALSLDGEKCRVLIIDDSSLMRQAVRKVLSRDRNLEIAGEGNSAEALELVKDIRPDVVILDIKGQDSLRTLKQVMILSPIPVVIFSALAHEGASITFDTLKFGAVDFMAKPSNILSDEQSPLLDQIIRKVHHAAQVTIESARYIRSVRLNEKPAPETPEDCRKIVCFGAAEGGYASLLKIIPGLSAKLPVAYFVILHVTPQHVDAFINYLDKHCSVRIHRARNGQPVETGTCYLASGYEYTAIGDDADGRLMMRVKQAPRHDRRDSIDIFMLSLAQKLKNKSVGIILSGAGKDGTEGGRKILEAGGTVLMSDPANCLYKNMVHNMAKYIDKKNILPEAKIANIVKNICMQDVE